MAVRQAAELYQNLEGDGRRLPDHPGSRDLAGSSTASRRRIPGACSTRSSAWRARSTAISAGNDRKFGTPDDIRDDFKDVDIKRVKNL